MAEQRRAGSDPAEDRPASGGETGLEEPVGQLSLGGGDAGGGSDGDGDGGAGEPSYPERPAEPNCIYYMRTGFCGYGERCRFNHPRDRALAYRGVADGYYPERDGQPLCQYYMRTGSCKFGSSCKYHHPRPGASSAAAVGLNVCGYPLRPGEKECPYYMKTAQCKFGVTCKFNHPQPGSVQAPNTASSVQSSATPNYGVVAGGWQMARPPVVPGSYVQGPYGPMLYSPSVPPVPSWNPYMPPVGALPAPSIQSTMVGSASLYGNPPMTMMAPPYAGPYPAAIPSSPGPSSSFQREPTTYPERPGQPDCQHYLRTGECKYGMWCKYHHPADWVAWRANFALSPMGLPLRPDAPICTYFVQHGVCKYGPTCKFNHPMSSLSYSPSATSLSDLPVAPFAPPSTVPRAEAGPETQPPSARPVSPGSESGRADEH